MSVRLSWGSANAALAESIKIYRADQAFSTAALPTPLATIAGSATTYDDTTAVRNRTYYYRVGLIRGGAELFSQQFIMGHYPDTGPGPKTIIRGNWACGYFGVVPIAEVFSISGLLAAIGSAGAGLIQQDVTLTGWHKFVRKGKILFIPVNRFSTGNLSQGLGRWTQLYNQGLVYGVDGPGAAPQALTNYYQVTALVNQKKVVSIGQYQFLVRLPKFADGPTDVVVPTVEEGATGEWVELMSRTGSNTTLPTTPTDKWNDYSHSMGAPTQNFSSLVNNIRIYNELDKIINDNQVTGVSVSSEWQWFPVLELIL